MEKLNHKTAPFQILLLLMLSGEAIFLLPFVLARVFRPTFLSALHLDNTQLGNCFSVYGIVALLSYFLGGWLADRFAPGKLMAIALFLTAGGGFYLATLPSYTGMIILFGYWGFTTIFLFWAAMIKATRIWGGENAQGKAFGFLEAGRGLVASSIAIISAFIFSMLLTANVEVLAEKQSAFQSVVVFASLFVIVIGLLVYFFLKTPSVHAEQKDPKNLISNYWVALKIPTVLLLMVIILSAYVGYKSTDFISLYADQIMGYDEGDSAKIGALFLYLRPIVAVVIGLLADQSRATFWIVIGFIVMLVGALLFTFGVVVPDVYGIFFFSSLILGLGVYATRTLYFALLKEGGVPLVLTGVAVSLVSVVGYLPDIFMGPLSGYYLDNYPGKIGFQYIFGVLSVFSLIGLVASVMFTKLAKHDE